MKEKKRLSGAAQLKARGLKAVLVGFTDAERELLERAREQTRQSLFQFVSGAAVEKAKKVTNKLA